MPPSGRPPPSSPSISGTPDPISPGACCAWGDKAAGIRDASFASISRLRTALCEEYPMHLNSSFVRLSSLSKAHSCSIKSTCSVMVRRPFEEVADFEKQWIDKVLSPYVRSLLQNVLQTKIAEVLRAKASGDPLAYKPGYNIAPHEATCASLGARYLRARVGSYALGPRRPRDTRDRPETKHLQCVNRGLRAKFTLEPADS